MRLSLRITGFPFAGWKSSSKLVDAELKKHFVFGFGMNTMLQSTLIYFQLRAALVAPALGHPGQRRTVWSLTRRKVTLGTGIGKWAWWISMHYLFRRHTSPVNHSSHYSCICCKLTAQRWKLNAWCSEYTEQELKRSDGMRSFQHVLCYQNPTRKPDLEPPPFTSWSLKLQLMEMSSNWIGWQWKDRLQFCTWDLSNTMFVLWSSTKVNMDDQKTIRLILGE